MIDVTSLLPYCNKAAAKRTLAALPPSERPDKMYLGTLGAISFIVTLDGDGECEASVCAPFGKPSDASIAAFFLKWGQPIPARPPTAISEGRGLHWVIKPGVTQ